MPFSDLHRISPDNNSENYWQPDTLASFICCTALGLVAAKGMVISSTGNKLKGKTIHKVYSKITKIIHFYVNNYSQNLYRNCRCKLR